MDRKVAGEVKKDCIPEHLVTKILLKTPIKSILRFSEGLDRSSQIEFHRPHSFEIVASCNGVVSLRVRHREFDGSWRLILWNPSIKKTLYLPPPRSCASTVTTLLGLGYDPRSDDYKFFSLNSGSVTNQKEEEEEVKRDRIPEHLVTKILLKTPIKSILRFRCVSQSWNSLVTLPYFIKEHLANAIPLILRTENPVVSLSLLLDSEGLDRSSQIEFQRPHSFEIVASCNGVVSLRVRHREFDGSWRLILWNPSIKKTLYLPPPRSCASTVTTLLGLGYDPRSDDYKFFSLNSGSVTNQKEEEEEVKRDRIPEHLVTKILLKTPIKSILRFRCVSQSWNSLVTLPYFIKEHLANAKPLILRTENPVVSLSLLLDSEGLDRSSQIEFHRPHSFEIVASCNGVVSLRALAMIQEVMTIRFLARIVRLGNAAEHPFVFQFFSLNSGSVTNQKEEEEEVKRDRIPEHLVTKILLKTPIKSILRFRCVSQSWNSLVTLPYFIKEHLANAIPLILRTENPVVSLSLLLDSEGLDRSSQIEFQRPYSFEIVASCNGVVSLRVRHRELMAAGAYLWNHQLRTYLPPPRSCASTVTTLLGLGYDPRSDDYKFFSLNSGSVTNQKEEEEEVKRDRIPEHLVTKILLKTPIKSILRFSEGLDRSSQIEFHRPHSFEIVASCNGVVSLRALAMIQEVMTIRFLARIVRLGNAAEHPFVFQFFSLNSGSVTNQKEEEEEVKRDRIPKHLATKILLKTPIKSILRFRCVSQSWNSLVTLPYFIKEHLANVKPLILRTENPVVSLSLLLDSEGLDRSSQIEFHRPHSFEIVASCNGVVSLRVRHREFDGSWRLILWNPSIKKTLYLPPPRSCATEHPFVFQFFSLNSGSVTNQKEEEEEVKRDRIPEHLVTKILLKTPIKSILRFRCVSQSWNSLVTLPYFIKEHLANAKPLILRTENPVVSLFLLLDSERLDRSSQIEFHRPHSFEIVASCNGVVSLRVRHREFDGSWRLILWNPSIKKTLYLPPPRSCASTVTTLLGLGYDPRSDD
uniref:F-box domain-containing protein n=1 Tax=Salix viminalis TaxID=40686 RepID=A0A6N2LRH4_SALVM